MKYDVTDFGKQVLERSRAVPVLVDFWAAWCGPCRALGPVLERLAGEAGGRWELAKLDTEAFPDVAAAYGIQSIPSVKLFVDGEVVDEFLGALPEAHVRRWLAGALPSPRAAAVAEARARLERREFAAAAEGLRGVLAVEPGNAEARVLLAEALLHTDPGAVAGALAELDQDSEDGDRAAALRALARVAELAGRPDELPAAPVRERFLEGAAAVRAGDWAAALAAFIDVLRAQRDYAGGLAKEAARAIFVLLGIRHPICERFHRAFSSAVNV